MKEFLNGLLIWILLFAVVMLIFFLFPSFGPSPSSGNEPVRTHDGTGGTYIEY